MVSKANDDFPEPERPVITINLFLGINKLMFFKLFTLAPCMLMLSILFIAGIVKFFIKKTHEFTKKCLGELKSFLFLQKKSDNHCITKHRRRAIEEILLFNR